MRRWGPKLVLLASSLTLTAIVIEVAFRLTTEATPWYQRLEEEHTAFFVPRQPIGGERFKIRAPLPPGPKATDSYRLLFLGDSFTYGSGVADPARTFAALATTELNARRPPGSSRRYEMFNGGIPGSLTGKWVRLFRAAAPLYDPDVVVAVFFLRDGTARLGGSGTNIREVGAKMTEMTGESWLARRSRAYRYFVEKKARRRYSAKYLGAMHDAYLGDNEQTAEWQRAQVNLRTIRNETQARGARFAMVVFPMLFSLRGDYPLERVCLEIERFARDEGIPVLSLLPIYRGRRDSMLWVSPLNQHPNEQGHALAAEPIANFIAGLTGDRP